ncbi:MAG TPA: glycosyltransferase 87 family protein, partial [Thermomicrobiales bacterium]|nr:glycosyltransferase 87 family protein [Thermomicrobiales bacterium]
MALAIVIGWSLANAIQRIGDWSLSDMDAYWNAATRLREGLPLYPAVPDSGAADVFRYAPWFAWAWVPLTFLPKAAVAVAWSALLVGASAVAIMPIVRQPSLTRIAAAALLGTILLWSAASGNVQPVIVAILVLGIEGRSGPLWVAIAASLKIFPIGFALVYAGRREWR